MTNGSRVNPSAHKPVLRPAAQARRRPFSLTNKPTSNYRRAILALGRNAPKVHRYSGGILSFDLRGRILDQDERGSGIAPFPIQYGLAVYPKATHINVRINSEGGSLVQAEKIYCALRAHGGHVTVIADRLCASAATIILMAGDLREATPGTRFLFHSPEISPSLSDGRWTRQQHESVAAYLQYWNTAQVDMFAARTGQNREIFAKEVNNEAPMFFSRAKALNIVHCLEGEESWHAGRPYYYSSPQAISMLARRQREFAEYRRAVMARFVASGMKSSAIFGHVAFSKAAGVDIDYARRR